MKHSLAIFGEILFDHFPDGTQKLGGAPFNIAWHLQAFHILPLLISGLGDDAPAYKIQAMMSHWGLETTGIQIHPQYPTGKVQVLLEQGEPQFNILPEQAYDFIDARQLPDIAHCKILYHGSLALRHCVARHAFKKLLDYQKPLFIDVNLRSPWWGKREVLHYLQQARWAKLNEEELHLLSPITLSHDLAQKAIALYQLCHLDWLVVTLGKNGALAIGHDKRIYWVKPSKNITVVDTVGAGDGFCALLLLGLLNDWPLAKTLKYAQQFAQKIVQIHGGICEDKSFYTQFYQQILLGNRDFV